MRTILFNLSVLCFVTIGFTQSLEIPWVRTRPLTWDDFKIASANSSEMSAETFSGITYEASIRSNSQRIEMELDVYAYFDKIKSWRKPDDLTPELLKHEQVHFDITELYARLLRKTFTEYSYSKQVDQNLLDQLFQQNQHRLDSVHRQYDLDTDHSRFAEGQKLWEQFIESSIRQFENYSDRNIKVLIDLTD